MSGRPANRVWVSGERFNLDYLLDTISGSVVRRAELAERGGTTGGIGRPCGGTFVAVYVSEERDGLVLQVGRDQVLLDESTTARHRKRLGGVLSELAISRRGHADLTVRHWNGAGALLGRLDPGYDELDNLGDDFLADVANVVNTPERRQGIISTKDPEAGPWDVRPR